MANSNSTAHTIAEPLAVFYKHQGQLRLSEALKLGINRYQFYKLRDEGLIQPISRGVYRLTELPPVEHPDLLIAATNFPKAVLCLISALAWHDLTTQIPHQLDLAVERNARPPHMEYPPVQGHRFSGQRFTVGVEAHQIAEGIELKVYSREKTLADCFAYRHQIGMDIVLEALKLYRERHIPDYKKLLEHAGIWRVEKLIKPYLEASLYG
ncbi:type IV toxin-antitoxin system AbiEi family antitoxin domain-containing protein [Marinospirillum sp.]|uniref:type IV toxin-antitoxin system AbiEi family antitoxin domain-containing protein n=1 Tax=Marinospirillum sp. TaxID=2183934 RepID=UPI00286FE98E|nr:type IV toxin-antitoxin system AbiEi family antitoxin domain-containing protein [Marinospirillum sp.]MDR9466804.1 type IV toxin-antitoxin system AbiEi family antitoxin domain-containing protein [Marinospirillum sp.]